MPLDFDTASAPLGPKDQGLHEQAGKIVANGKNQETVVPMSVNDQAENENAAKLAHNLAQWSEAQSLPGTPGATYLVKSRHLSSSVLSEPSLRWHEAHRLTPDSPPLPAILAKVVSSSTNELVALHAIRVDPETGQKAKKVAAKVSYGPVSDGVIRLGDPKSTTVALAEGLETGASRLTVAPCDLRICCGQIRFTPPQAHQCRVEIITDTGAEKKARAIARAYDDSGMKAFIVTVPKSIGPKCDLNDLLTLQGPDSVQQAVEEAERVEAVRGERTTSKMRLERGSDVEIAQQILEVLEDIYGRVAVEDGQVWRFNGSIWEPLAGNRLKRLIHGVDGSQYPTSNGMGTVKLSRQRVWSIEDCMLAYRSEEGFFLDAPVGIPCANGFIRFDPQTGEHDFEPHDRRQRQRHVLKGQHREVTAAEFEASHLAKLLRGAFQGDKDQEDKVRLAGELAGCVALGYGTRLPSPVAVILFGESGANGKSSFQDVLRGLANSEAICAVPPTKFGDEKYAIQLAGKVLNAVDELGDRAIRRDSFKSVITGEPLAARDLYRSATFVRPVALNVFSTNTLPSFGQGVDGGVLRRLLPVEFHRVIPESERIPNIGRRICEQEPDLLLSFAVEGAARLLKQGAFTVPATSRDLVQRWVHEVDVVRAWVDERLEITKEPHELWAHVAYQDFVAFCTSLGTPKEYIARGPAFGRRLKAAEPELKSVKANTTKYVNARLRTGGGSGW